MNQPRVRIKQGRASLIGGIAVALASFILWSGVAREFGAESAVWIILGGIVAGGIGIWIRVADL